MGNFDAAIFLRSERTKDALAAHLAPLPQALDKVIKWQFADLLQGLPATYQMSTITNSVSYYVHKMLNDMHTANQTLYMLGALPPEAADVRYWRSLIPWTACLA